MNKTKIEWTTRTWNPISGCTEISPGCAKWYVQAWAERLRGTVAWPTSILRIACSLRKRRASGSTPCAVGAQNGGVA